MSQSTTRRQPMQLPHNLEAEVSVLGAVIQSGEALAAALEILRPEDFYQESHRVVFAACQALFERGATVDLVTVAEELIQRGALDAAGGATALAALVDAVPSTASVRTHAEIVKDKAILSSVIQRSHETIAMAAGGEESSATVLEYAESELFKLSQSRVKQDFVPLKPLITAAYEKIEQLSLQKSAITGIPTGWDDLDYLTAGWQNSDMIVVAGRPSMGKTSWALNAVEYAAIHENIPVAIFSLEMSKEQVAQRMLCTRARVDSQRARVGQVYDADFAKLTIAAGPLSTAPIYIDDTPAITVTEMRAKARRLKSEGKCGLVVIDYMQLIGSARRGGSRQEEVSDISRAIKAMAKELNVPVIALSQLSRAVENRQPPRPQLSDLRESGSIEQDADVVLFLYRPSYYAPQTADDGTPIEDYTTEVVLSKQRNGPTGKIHLVFLKEYTRFEPLVDQPIGGTRP